MPGGDESTRLNKYGAVNMIHTYNNELVKLSDKIYREVNAINKSSLDDFHKSPKTYHLYHVLGKKKKETPAMTFGRALHAAILEPDVFGKEYIDDTPVSHLDKRTKAGKLEHELFAKENKDRTILKAGDYNTILEIKEAVLNHSAANSILQEAKEKEICAFWKNKDFDLNCKAKIDILLNDSTIGDFKTTTASDPYSFGKSIINYRYHVQAAFYLDGLAEITGKPATNYFIIACEKARPYNVMVYKLSKEYLALGQHQYYCDLQEYKKCLDSNNFYVDVNDGKVMELEPPSWASAELDFLQD